MTDVADPAEGAQVRERVTEKHEAENDIGSVLQIPELITAFKVIGQKVRKDITAIQRPQGNEVKQAEVQIDEDEPK